MTDILKNGAVSSAELMLGLYMLLLELSLLDPCDPVTVSSSMAAREETEMFVKKSTVDQPGETANKQY